MAARYLDAGYTVRGEAKSKKSSQELQDKGLECGAIHPGARRVRGRRDQLDPQTTTFSARDARWSSLAVVRSASAAATARGGEPVAAPCFPADRDRLCQRQGACSAGHAGDRRPGTPAGQCCAAAGAPSGKRTPVSCSETSQRRRATSMSCAPTERSTSFGAPRCSLKPPGPAKLLPGMSATAA